MRLGLTLLLLSISGIAVSATQTPQPNTYGVPVTLTLQDKQASDGHAAKESFPPWGLAFNCIPLCQSTANNMVFRFQDTRFDGRFNVALLGGVYYSLVKNFQFFANDVVFDLDLLDSNGYTIAKSSVWFSREECSHEITRPIKLQPAKEFRTGNPTVFPKPVRDAVAVRVTPHWISRDNAKCDGK